jgi:hypothetical protein
MTQWLKSSSIRWKLYGQGSIFLGDVGPITYCELFSHLKGVGWSNSCLKEYTEKIKPEMTQLSLLIFWSAAT